MQQSILDNENSQGVEINVIRTTVVENVNADTSEDAGATGGATGGETGGAVGGATGGATDGATGGAIGGAIGGAVGGAVGGATAEVPEEANVSSEPIRSSSPPISRPPSYNSSLALMGGSDHVYRLPSYNSTIALDNRATIVSRLPSGGMRETPTAYSAPTTSRRNSYQPRNSITAVHRPLASIPSHENEVDQSSSPRQTTSRQNPSPQNQEPEIVEHNENTDIPSTDPVNTHQSTEEAQRDQPNVPGFSPLDGLSEEERRRIAIEVKTIQALEAENESRNRNLTFVDDEYYDRMHIHAESYCAHV